MIAAFRIAAKDVRLRFRDRSAFIWGIIAPLGLAIVFSLLLGGVTGGGSLDVTFAVVDEDGGAVAQGFVGALTQLDADGVFSIETLTTAGEAETRVSAGDFDAALIIPTGFSDTVAGGASAAIQVIGYVDSPIGSQVARAVAEGFAGEVNGISVSVAAYFVMGAQQVTVEAGGSADEIVAAAQAVPTPLEVNTVGTASKELSSATFYAAAMAVFFLFFTVQFGVIGLIEEKEQGTMPRLLAAPIHPWSIVAGKVITAFVLGVVSMTVLVVATTWLPFMEAEWGNSLGVAILIVAGVLSAMGVMVLVAAFARTAETAGSIQAIVAFVLGMLGGAFFPVSQAGGWLATASLLTPHAWFLRGLGDLNGGGGPMDILPAAGYMLVFGAVTAGLAATRLRRVVRL
jgi:ABC-2 type transport system permease protein